MGAGVRRGGEEECVLVSRFLRDQVGPVSIGHKIQLSELKREIFKNI